MNPDNVNIGSGENDRSTQTNEKTGTEKKEEQSTQTTVLDNTSLKDAVSQTSSISIEGASTGSDENGSTNSPRDKKQKVHTPSNSPGRPTSAAQNFMVAGKYIMIFFSSDDFLKHIRHLKTFI